MIEYTISSHLGDGDFLTVTQALLALPKDSNEPITLRIHPGIYKEKITICRNHLTLLGTGASPEETILTFDDYAFAQMEDGSNRGTFRSYSVFVDASDVTIQNLTIENSSGDENLVGQAIALYVDGDRFQCLNCRLLSRQDTLFTGPLPPKELQPGGFIGPKQFAPRINGRHYYKDCTICGNIDFIFGSATAYFDHCHLISLMHREDQSIQGYVTAPSTPEGQEYGYVFYDCSFTSSECPQESVYLARPWRDYGQSVFLHCVVGPHIHPDLFHDWGKSAAREHCFFSAYRLTNKEGSNILPKASFSRMLTKDIIDHYSKENVLQGNDHWNP